MKAKLRMFLVLTILAALLISCSTQSNDPVIEEAAPAVEEAAPAVDEEAAEVEEAPEAEEAVEVEDPALVVSGVPFSRDQLEGMETLVAEATKKDDSIVEYTGVLVSSLLAEAGAVGDTVVITASDGYEAEASKVEVDACADCIVAFDGDELRMVLPGFPSNVQVKGVVSISVKRVLCIFAQKYTLRGVQNSPRLESNCDLECILHRESHFPIQ